MNYIMRGESSRDEEEEEEEEEEERFCLFLDGKTSWRILI